MRSTAPERNATTGEAPVRLRCDLGAEAAVDLLTASADIAVVIDPSGIVRDVAFSNQEPLAVGHRDWVDRPWIETVTVESRPKIDDLLREALAGRPARWRQVNHPVAGAPDLPVRYLAARAGRDGEVVGVGRDLRPMAQLQQRLVEAQIGMEREYARLRQSETRYRLLFRSAAEPVLIVDGRSLAVVEANPAAAAMLANGVRVLTGRALPDLFDSAGAQSVRMLLAAVRTSGRAEDVQACSNHGREAFIVSASMFRQDQALFYLVRLMRQSEAARPPGDERVRKVLERLPEAFVVTDSENRILTANPAFLEMAQMATEDHVRGETLERWLGRSGIDMPILAANLADHGAVSRFPTILRGEYGLVEEVEVAAVSAAGSEPGAAGCRGFAIRSIAGRQPVPEPVARDLERSVEEMTRLVGRVPLRDLVRETTDMIEKLCIEAALQLTADNRASAAEVLGLSRQSLYSKLRRYGLGDLDGDDKTLI